MDCAEARDLLPEHALGAAGARDSAAVDRHLVLCAACRKEVRDLADAAATLAFALAPETPDPSLEDQVVSRVREVTGPVGSVAGAGRRRRPTTVLVAAALLITSVTGTVLAVREDPSPGAAQAEAIRRQEAMDQFARFLESAEFADPETRAYVGWLGPRVERVPGSGSALTIISPTVEDRVIVIVNGLEVKPRSLPLVVSLEDHEGHIAVVGKIQALDTGGGETVGRLTSRDLSGFLTVLVRDARGRVVLSGFLEAHAPVASPAP